MNKSNKQEESKPCTIHGISERLYSMELHETIRETVGPVHWHITRVPSGWIYSRVRLNARQTSAEQMNTVFVPFDNAFQNAR